MGKCSQPQIDRDWETEQDLRHLREAFEIKKDKARLTRVRKLAQKEVAALKNVGGRE